MSNSKVLDDEQRAAYMADHNVVVSAGAGSGKTTVLSRRYVRLIKERKLSIEAILTLTFTRKAATEMFSRIHEELIKLDDPWVQEQLQRFDMARIDTLDSFCSTIVRGSCQNYGIPPNFTIDEMRLKSLAEQTAMEFLMENRNEPVVAQLVSIYSFDRIVRDFLADFCQYHLPMVNCPSFRELAEKQVAYNLVEINNKLQILSSCIAEGSSLDKGSGQKTLAAIVDTLSKYTSCPAEYSETAHAAIETICADILAVRLPGKTTPGSSLERAKEIFSTAKESCRALRNLLAFYQNRDHILKAGELLDELSRRFNRKKRNEALLSFGDLIDLAVDILATSLPLRNYYKNQIRAIMIDEFQDNNEKQKELLYLLAEDPARENPGIPGPEQLAPDKLFFVGDEKQSIYRFRGADVSVFKRLSEELTRAPKSDAKSDADTATDTAADTAGENQISRQLSISTNYRSVPELIQFFNTLFPGVFGNASEDYEASYTQARSSPEKPPSGAVPVEFLLNPFQTDDEYGDTGTDDNSEDGPAEGSTPDAAPAEAKQVPYCSASETEALAVARRIIQGISEKEFSAADVALLFRTTTHQSDFERVFRTVGIPFASADPRGLFLDAPANDFYALLQLVIFPQDTNAYATVLRSPFVNLSDRTFLRLMLEVKAKPRYLPFGELAEEFWLNGEPEDRERYAHGAILYRQLEAMADTQGIATIVAWLWYDSGYRTSLLADSDMNQILGHFQLFYDLAVKADQRHLTLSAFLDELAPLIGSSERIEQDETDKGLDAVTFMTIHKSKGLQFPVVIVPQAGAASQTERNEHPYFYSRDFGPVISWKPYSKNSRDTIQNPLFEQLREEENRQNRAELKRLLYVALTRAERKCIIAGSRKLSKSQIDEFNTSFNEEPSYLEGVLFTKPQQDKKKVSFFDLLAQGIEQVPKTLYSLTEISPVPITEKGRELARLREAMSRYRTAGAPPIARPPATPAAFTSAAALGPASSRLDPKAAFYLRPPIPPIVAAPRTTSPTAMERLWQKTRTTEPEKIQAPQLPRLPVDPIIASSSKDLETLFGTLCHGVIQNLLEDRGTDPTLSLLSELKAADLSSEHQSLFIDEANKLARAFLESELGKAALEAKPQLRTEYAVLLPLLPPGTAVSAAAHPSQSRPILVQGSIDLIFETATHCVIIDFKTDKALIGEAHRIQMECYHRAGKAFSDKPVQTLLVYLRGMEIVELTPRLSDAELYQLAQDSLSEEAPWNLESHRGEDPLFGGSTPHI